MNIKPICNIYVEHISLVVLGSEVGDYAPKIFVHARGFSPPNPEIAKITPKFKKILFDTEN